VRTRYVPGFPGVQALRLEENLYQNPITGEVYDYEGGFTDVDGKANGGGSVRNQTLYDSSFYNTVPHPVYDIQPVLSPEFIMTKEKKK